MTKRKQQKKTTRPDNNFLIDTNHAEKMQTPILGALTSFPAEPTVMYTPEFKIQMDYIVE
jgi:hypothetical protein